MTPTDLVSETIRKHSDLSERAIVDLIIATVNDMFGGGNIDSHKVASILYDRRGGGSWHQCKDYTQHMFREAKFVCRHADGHHYHVHPQAECSATCADRYAKSHGEHRRPISECCFVEVTTQGTCPFGCDE